MAELRDVVIYICNNLRKNENPLSIEKLEWIIFLCDWKSVLKNHRQITDIEWEVTNSDPSTDRVVEFFTDFVKQNPQWVQLEKIEGTLGLMRMIISFKRECKADLDQESKSIVDLILTLVSTLTPLEFSRLVRSTYPIYLNTQYEKLNLVKLATEYEKIPG